MNYISLGYFCSVASELEKFGLRTESSPFDWVISDFEGVTANIKNHFSGYLDYNLLAQNVQNRAIYKNIKYNISFFHDFNNYEPLKEQLPKVLEKYNRRIERFYKSITNPTLFIRYISDEATVNGVSKELLYIEENYEQILELLKSFNPHNDILFIANDEVQSSKLTIYHVTKDSNDKVARNPIGKNPTLYKIFSDAEVPNKQKNIERCLEKEKYRKNICHRVKNKIMLKLRKILKNEYIHDKRYE